MDFSGLDLNLLVALDALFAEKSVSRAGERLHLSQSATSGALARLREAFHDPLLVQVGRRMALTALGEELVEPVRQFLLQAEAILYSNPDFDPAASTRKFRMVMSDYVATVVMTQALPLIEKLAPGVTVELLSNLDAGSEALDRGEIDLAITPAKVMSSVHPSERLFEDEFVCVAWSGNVLINRHISLDTYLSLGHVVVRFGKHQQVPTFDEWFVERFGHNRRIEVVTTAFNLVPQLLVGTRRIATMHSRLAAFYQRYLPLTLFTPPLEIPPFEESMQWHRSRDRDPGTIWLRTILKSALDESGARKITKVPVARGNGRTIPAVKHRVQRPAGGSVSR